MALQTLLRRGWDGRGVGDRSHRVKPLLTPDPSPITLSNQFQSILELTHKNSITKQTPQINNHERIFHIKTQKRMKLPSL